MRNPHVAEDIAIESVGVEGTADGEKFDVVRTPLVQVLENAACVVCHNNLVQCCLKGSLVGRQCRDLVVTLELEKLADGLVNVASTVGLWGIHRWRVLGRVFEIERNVGSHGLLALDHVLELGGHTGRFEVWLGCRWCRDVVNSADTAMSR